MSNIHTYEDLKDKPNASPLPDPWRKSKRQSGTIASFDDEAQLPDSEQRYLRVATLGGQEVDIPVDSFRERPGSFLCTYCCVSLCPCFVGPLWSDDKRKSYISILLSFCFFISIVQIVMLIVELSMGVASFHENPSLGPTSNTLHTLGAKYAPDMKSPHYQLWRFITPIFLHAGLIPLLFHLFFQLRFGLQMEKKWGLVKFIPIYFLGGIGGLLASGIILPNLLSAGAGAALLSVLGAGLAEILMRWHLLDPVSRRMNLISMGVIIGVILLFSVIAGPSGSSIDWPSYLGGLIVGLLMGGTLFGRYFSNGTGVLLIVLCSGCAVVLYFFVGFTLFFLL